MAAAAAALAQPEAKNGLSSRVERRRERLDAFDRRPTQRFVGSDIRHAGGVNASGVILPVCRSPFPSATGRWSSALHRQAVGFADA